MPTEVLYLRGDQIGTYSNFSGTGNNAARIVTVNGVQAVGTAADTFVVIVEQVNTGVDQFQNGQFVTVYDSAGNIVMPRTNAQPDIEQGFGAGDEHLIFQQSNFLFDLGGLPVGPETLTYTIADESRGVGDGDNDGELDFADFICVAAGTRIDTPNGPVDIAELRPGDLISTPDNGAVAIEWIGKQQVTLPETGKPILIGAGSLGAGSPQSDVIVSPDHRILISSPACEFLFGTDEVLAPAKGLTGLPKVREMRGKKTIEYVNLLTKRHEIMTAEGLRIETLYPGEQALSRLSDIARAGILSCCPALRREDVATVYPPARRMLTVQETRSLVDALMARHKSGGQMWSVKPETVLSIAS